MKIFIIYILALSPFFLVGQIDPANDTVYSDATLVVEDSSNFDKAEIEKFIQDKKLKIQVEVGSSFGSSLYGGGQYFGTYLAPQIRYQMTPRFSIGGGAMLTSTYGSPYYEPSRFGNSSSNFNRTFLFVSGAYKLTDRLTLTGAAYKEINLLQSEIPSSPALNYDYQGVIMGAEFQISDNVFIKGEIEISNGYNPYRHSPYSFPSNNFNPSPVNMFDDGPN